jgi:uncharacterized protein YukE
MIKHNLVAVLAGTMFLFCAGPALGVMGLGVIAANQGAEALTAWVEQQVNELKSEANTQKNRERLYNNIDDARRKLDPIIDTTKQSLDEIAAEQKRLQARYAGAPVSEWSAKDRADYEQMEQARAALLDVQKGAHDAWENLKWMQARRSEAGFVPFKNPTFVNRFNALKMQLLAVEKGFNDFNQVYNLEPSESGEDGPRTQVVRTSFATARNDSSEMIFYVNGAELRPGANGSVRLGDQRAISIRALSYDATRQRLFNTEKALREKKLKYVVHGIHMPNMIRYGTDGLETVIRSTNEDYHWTWGNQVARFKGQASEWSVLSARIPAPAVSSSRVGVASDSVVWVIPTVDEGSVDFTFSVVADVEGEVSRTLASGEVEAQTPEERSEGQLIVTVAPQAQGK